MSIHSLTSFLELVSREVSEDCQANTLRTFLFVAGRGNCTQKDVEAFLKTSNATTSRNVSYWTDRKFDRSKGKDFIDRTTDDHDRRMRNLRLTPKGKAFYEEIKKISGLLVAPAV